jgi:hypothetical protein
MKEPQHETGEHSGGSLCSDWFGMDSAPTDGTEVVGWVPHKGHCLMRYRDGWEQYKSIPHVKPGFTTMGWARFGNKPTHWRPKQENSREWIY